MSDFAELNTLLKGGADILNGTCTVTLENRAPAGIVIESGGVKFFYSDGSDYTDGPRHIGLSPGQSTTFRSGNASKCVRQYFMAITVNDTQTGHAANYTYQSEMEPAGQCLISDGLVFGPANVASAAELALIEGGQVLGIRRSAS